MSLRGGRASHAICVLIPYGLVDGLGVVAKCGDVDVATTAPDLKVLSSEPSYAPSDPRVHTLRM
jgi:hypothetical protein